MTLLRCTQCPSSVDGICTRDVVELSGTNAHCSVLYEIMLHKHERMLERVREAERNHQQLISVHEIRDPERDEEEREKE
jgi:hypothetical protein